MNEQQAILTSINMSKTYDEKSIDLGYMNIGIYFEPND